MSPFEETSEARALSPRPDPAAPPSSQGLGWKRALAAAIRDPTELIGTLGLSKALIKPARRAATRFPLLVPRGFLARMRRGDPADPLLRQVLPLEREEEEVPGYGSDPVGDAAATCAPGLLRKYAGRALLIATATCAMHCRYCFRREYPYETAPKGMAEWRPALDQLAGDSSIQEVILSGGDPLLLTDRALDRLVREIEVIPHVRQLRIHTRLPIVLPERVTDALLGILCRFRLQTRIVVHANHPAELADDCAGALTKLADAGIPLLNQAVLLRGVNDDPATLFALSQRLVDLRVLPYYLHQLDPVRGAAHFFVPEARGITLIDALRRKLPGYAVPRYVREEPGAPGKVEILAPRPT